VGKKLDLIGHQYNRLTVIEETNERKFNNVVWLCECECGNKVKVSAKDLRQNLVVSCGCSKNKTWNEKRSKEIGKKYGRLTVIEVGISKGRYKSNYLCRCDCGKNTEVRGDSLKKGHIVSCGCYHREIVSKENSHFYKPELTNEDRMLGRNKLGETTKAWRKKVMERDCYTCQLCGNKKGNNFNVHHLDGWNWCKEKRFDEDNAITLCIDCHKQFHKQYGKGDNTKEQFEEYKNKVLV